MLILQGTILLSQEKASRQSSIEDFIKGDYEKAYGEFKELLKLYPKDPLYKYYSGVCLVKLDRNPEEAAILLSESRTTATVARIVPADAIYWQGRALQMSGKYAEAIDSYNTFSEQSSKKAARELGVPELIEQCNNKKGELTVSEPIIVKPVIAQPAEEAPREPLKPEEKTVQTVLPGTNNIKISDTLPDNYDRILSEAMVLQVSADSLYKISENLKKTPPNTDYKTKAELKSRITETENMAASYQKQADQKYAEVQAAMNTKPFADGIPAVQKTFPANDTSESEQVVITKTGSGSENNQAAIKDSLKVEKSTAPQPTIIKNKEAQEVHDTVSKQVIKTSSSPVQNQSSAIYSIFEASGMNVPAAGEKIRIDPAVPPGLIYRIQIAVFRNPVAPSYFKGIIPVYGFKVPGTDNTNYCAGMFRRVADANKALAIVRKKGFRDAFVISLFGGKAVSTERAAILEKEWGKKPFQAIFQIASGIPVDTVPPTLAFRVELLRSLKPVKDDALEAIKRIAGSRGLDIESMKNDSTVYLIGKFITYESAEEYAGLLIRNGYHNAKVVARLGKKEIPVETARELFEKP